MFPLKDLRRHCVQAAEYGFKTVRHQQCASPLLQGNSEGSGVLVDAAVSFPLGQCTIETKVFETQDVIAKGAG